MKAPLMLAIDPLQQSYTKLYTILLSIHELPETSLEDKAEKMRVCLYGALKAEEPNSPKAIAVYKALMTLLTSYPKNERKEEGWICPISFETLDFEQPAENYYCSASGYVYKTAAIKTWFETKLEQDKDPINQQQLSRHEMNLLYPEREFYLHFQDIAQRDLAIELQRGMDFQRDFKKAGLTGFLLVCLSNYIAKKVSQNDINVSSATFGVGCLLWIGVLCVIARNYSRAEEPTTHLVRLRGAPRNPDQTRGVTPDDMPPPRLH